MEPCHEGWKDAEFNKSGRCCCNCEYQRVVVAHPWNKNEFTKGSILKEIGYVCTTPEFKNVTFMDRQHSMCECHEWRNENV